jgi:hypothetical protein
MTSHPSVRDVIFGVPVAHDVVASLAALSTQ